MLSANDNQRNLQLRIRELPLLGKWIVCFDFDELIVPIHLSRKVTYQISKPIDEKRLVMLGKSSFVGISYLRSLYYGYDFGKYELIRNRECGSVHFREGFLDLLCELRRRYAVIFITSGIADVCAKKVFEAGFLPKCVIGGELAVSGGVITGSSLIVTDTMKGEIVDAIRNKYKVLSVGHSRGDHAMLRASDVSVGFCADYDELAQFHAKDAAELRQIILRETK